MAQALPMVMLAAEPTEEWAAGHEPPRVEARPYTPRELWELFRGGEREADDCERLLVLASRARGGIDLSIGEGLAALRQGERLAELGYHLDDYGREVLDLERRTVESLAHLATELRSRPLLRAAVASGRVHLRAAQAVLPVARGEAEAAWVERASRETVRALEADVCAERSRQSCFDRGSTSASSESARPEPVEGRAGRYGAGARLEDDEEWRRFSGWLEPEEQALLDQALELAGEILPAGGGRIERLEAMAQEYLAGHPCEEDREGQLLQCSVRVGPRPEAPPDGGVRARAAALEVETERWAHLREAEAWPAPKAEFDTLDTAWQVDSRLRTLARMRAGWDKLIGQCARTIQQSRMHLTLGFATFRQYVEERLGLPARAVEQRAALEGKVWGSKALQEARRQKVSYEKLRLLSRLPEGEIASWIPRAKALTCVALRRKLEAELQRQLCAQRRVRVSLPRSIAVTLAAAIHAARRVAGGLIPVGRCLARMAQHFLDTWRAAAKRLRGRSRRIRRRDQGLCQVPGCSHKAEHAHHVVPRARGGSDDPSNLVAVCPFHHLRCIHGGHLRVWGRAPDGLVWLREGKPWGGGDCPP